MGLYQVTTPVGLPSGELADFSHWGNAVDNVAAAAGVAAWQASLAASAPFLALFSTTTTFGESKVSEVSLTTGAILTSFMAGTAFAGSNIDGGLPPQVAICVTLDTAILSRTTRGRYYLPAPGHDILTAVGRIPTGDQGSLLTALVDAHTDEITAGLTPTVYSRKNRSTEDVTRISIGDVFDTIRTRRDKLVEVRVSDTL